MRIAEPDQFTISSATIRDDLASRCRHLLDERDQIMGNNIWHKGHPDSPASLAADLYSDANPALIAHHTRSFPSDTSADHYLIDFNCPGQKIATRAHHGAPKLVQTGPGSLVASQSQNALQAQCAHAAFLTSDVPHGTKPKAQGHAAAMENSSGGNRRIFSASTAVQQSAARSPCLPAIAARALKAIRPSELD